MAYGCGVTVKDGLDIGSQQAAEFRNALYELLCDFFGTTRCRLMEYPADIVNLMGQNGIQAA